MFGEFFRTLTRTERVAKAFRECGEAADIGEKGRAGRTVRQRLAARESAQAILRNVGM
jgi:hypothetical protein